MKYVKTDVRDRVATVTLSDPDRRNAINAEMVGEIRATFDQLDNDPGVGAIIVTGDPPAFCAGADLSHLGSSEREGLRFVYDGFLRVARSPLPTIAAVNGAAVGAGVNLALVCDVRLAAESARFDTRFLQLGLHPGGGHTWMMRRIAGPQTAFATVLFGEILDGREAQRAGLVWRCVPDAELLAAARALAARPAAAPRELVRKIKETIADVAALGDQDSAVDRELDPQVWSLNQPEFRERLAALQRKIKGGAPGR
ncbi:MAG: enoyl-CoA hydratase [Candidatus Binatia bacterium]